MSAIDPLRDEKRDPDASDPPRDDTLEPECNERPVFIVDAADRKLVNEE